MRISDSEPVLDKSSSVNTDGQQLVRETSGPGSLGPGNCSLLPSARRSFYEVRIASGGKSDVLSTPCSECKIHISHKAADLRFRLHLHFWRNEQARYELWAVAVIKGVVRFTLKSELHCLSKASALNHQTFSVPACSLEALFSSKAGLLSRQLVHVEIL